MRVRPTRVRRLRIRKAIGNATLATLVLAFGATYLAAQKSVTLVVNGRPHSIRTLSANVGELLDMSGIGLEGQETVEPPPSTPLADGMTVVVDTQSRATSEGSGDVGVWVVDADGPSAKLVVGSASAPPWAEIGVGTSRTVRVRAVVMGKAHDVLTNARTVRDLLSAMGTNPGPEDRVQPPPSTPLHSGMIVRDVDVQIRTRRVYATIPVRTMTTYSAALSPGTVRIASAGQPGTLLEVYRVKSVNGKVVSRVLVRRVVLQPAEPRRQIVGGTSGPHGTETGEASWYSFAPGSGFTAAHPWLPFGTVVTVTNLATGKSIQVVINDRGPFGGRIIDLSEEAFSALASLGTGVIDVRLAW